LTPIGPLIHKLENLLLNLPFIWVNLSSHGNRENNKLFPKAPSRKSMCPSSATTCEIQWISYFLKDIWVSYFQSALLYCDNQSTIQISNNQVFHKRKNTKIYCHVVQNRLLKLLPISSSVQAADIVTKPLPQSAFTNLYSKLGMKNMYSHLERGW